MKASKLRMHKQRMILHNLCMQAQVWEDEEHFRCWLQEEFGVRSRKQLTDKQLTDYWRWMRAFLGLGARPSASKSSNSITVRQKWKIVDLIQAKQLDEDGVSSFVKRQVGADLPIDELNKQQASKVINGLMRLM